MDEPPSLGSRRPENTSIVSSLGSGTGGGALPWILLDGNAINLNSDYKRVVIGSEKISKTRQKMD